MTGLLERKLSKSREALLRSCVQMLSVKSWDDISIDDIENYIHKTRGAIFHHYKTKDELFSNAIAYFVARSNLCHPITEVPICYTFIETLKDVFDIDNPEKAFINLVSQALYKRINLIPNSFLKCSPEQVGKEEQALGKILFRVLTN